MVTKRIANQGIFNENLRRSFEKLAADKTERDVDRLTCIRSQSSIPTLQVRRYTYESFHNSGAIQFVNNSSDSEFESLSPTKETFNRHNKSREVLRRNARKGSVGSATSSSSDSLKTNKCDDDKERDYRIKYDFNQKESDLLGHKKAIENLNRKLHIKQYENIRLKKENEDLKEESYKTALKLSDVGEDLERCREREEGLKFMVTRLSNIVQGQDEEIARLHHLDRNSDESHKVKAIENILKQTETKLVEQQEVNQQLRKYLEMLVLKLC